MTKPTKKPIVIDALQQEENETRFTAETAKRCAILLTQLLHDATNLQRTQQIITKWLSKNEPVWLEAIHSPLLFDATLRVCKMHFTKPVLGRILQAIIRRLSVAPATTATTNSALDLLQWLREKKSDYFSLADLKPHIDSLVQVLIKLVGKTARHWRQHALMSIQVASTLLSLNTILIALGTADSIVKQIGTTVDLPGFFLIKNIVLPLIVSAAASDGLSPPSQIRSFASSAEAECWMEIMSFALQTCAKSQRAVQVLGPLIEPIALVFSQYCELCAAAQQQHDIVVTALQSVRFVAKDLPLLGLQVLQAMDVNRHLLLVQVNTAYHDLAAALAESGVALVGEQVVRWGTVWLTCSFPTLQESDKMETMLLLDLEFLLDSKFPRYFQDGRLVYRVCQSCMWPQYSPLVANRALDLVKLHGLLDSTAFTRLYQTRFVGDSNQKVLTAREMFAQNPQHWTPTFALDTSDYRILRAKRFADVVLSDDDGDANEDDKLELFWECVFESAPAEQGARDQDLDSWLRFWACRALTLCSLKSRFGSAKDTFEHLELALNAKDDESALLLLWTLHRELVVFAPMHPDAKVSAFFAQKNADVCQSWLLRLVNVAVGSRIMRTGLPHLAFYYSYYDRPAKWTVQLLEQFAVTERSALVRALCAQRETPAIVQNKCWMDAIELYSRGAWCLAKEAFAKATAEADDDESNADVVASAKRMLDLCETKLGRWTATIPVRESSVHSSSLFQLEMEITTAMAVERLSVVDMLKVSGETLLPPLAYNNRSSTSSNAVNVTVAALESGDFELAKIVLPHVVAIERQQKLDVKSRIEVGRLIVSCTNQPEISTFFDVLCPAGSFERKLVCEPMEITESDVFAVADKPVGGLGSRALADISASKQDWGNAIRFHQLAMVWGDTDAFLLLLTDLDQLTSDQENVQVSVPSPQILLPHIDQLLVRCATQQSKSATLSAQFVHDCLMCLVEAYPRETAWALVAVFDENSPVHASLVEQITPQSIWLETKHFVAALIQAARSAEEEISALFEDLTKRQLFVNGRASPFLGKFGWEVHEKYFSAQATTNSRFDIKFLSSECGKAVEEWCMDAGNGKKFAAARDLLASRQNSKLQQQYSASELSTALLGNFTFVDGTIVAVRDQVQVLKTKTRPRRIHFTSGQSFLLKSGEDLRVDSRINQLWRIVCPSFPSYRVVPLSRTVGLIEWVDGAVPMFHAYRDWKQDFKFVEEESLQDEYSKALEDDATPLDAFRMLKLRRAASAEALKRFIWKLSSTPAQWLQKVERFTETTGTASALGWLVGLGDRHLDNILFNVRTGETVHVDLNVCFDKGQELRVPETVPFRLTDIMTHAFLLGNNTGLVQGPFGASMLSTVRNIKYKQQEVLSFLSVFAFDPASTTTIRKSDLDEAEFESAKAQFVDEAKAWLGETAQWEAFDASNSIDEEEESPRLQLERARSQAYRMQMECDRQKERAALALDRILTCNRLLQALSTEDAPQHVLSALERTISQVRRFSALSKLMLACVTWSNRFNEVLKRVTASANVPMVDWQLRTPPAALEFDPSDIALLSEHCNKKQHATTASKRQADFMALCDSILVLNKLAEGEIERSGALQAWEALQRAYHRIALPALRLLCARAPVCTSKLAAGLEYKQIEQYCALVEGGKLAVDQLREARALLQAALPKIQYAQFTAATSNGDAAKRAARQANERVRLRVEECFNANDLVSRLVDQATSEDNLSQMYVGWMPFI